MSTACPCWRGASRRSSPAGVAHREQFAILRRQIADDGGEPCPERIWRNSGLGRGFRGDKIEQDGSDLQSMGIDTIHDGLSGEAAVRAFSGVKTKRREGAFGALLASKPGHREGLSPAQLRKQWHRLAPKRQRNRPVRRTQYWFVSVDRWCRSRFRSSIVNSLKNLCAIAWPGIGVDIDGVFQEFTQLPNPTAVVWKMYLRHLALRIKILQLQCNIEETISLCEPIKATI